MSLLLHPRGRASLTARAAAVLIIIVTAASALLTGIYVLPGALVRGRLIIRAFYLRDGSPVQIENASFSVWAWAPTQKGTELMPIFNGTGGEINIDMSKLLAWVEDWLRYYGPGAMTSFMPSIIVWVMYPIDLPNGSVELAIEPQLEPLNLSVPLSGSGAVLEVQVSHPFKAIVGPGQLRPRAASVGAVMSAQTTTTTTTVLITNTTSALGGQLGRCWHSYYYEAAPHVLSWYPNSSGVAPISLAVAVLQPSPDATSNNLQVMLLGPTVQYVGFNAVMIASGAIGAAAQHFNSAGLEALSEATKALSPLAVNPSLSFEYVSVSSWEDGNVFTGGPDVAQLYVVGQIAFINWTVVKYSAACDRVVDYIHAWYLGPLVTAVNVYRSGTGVAPIVHLWYSYVNPVNLSAWAEESALAYEASQGNEGAAEILGSLEVAYPPPPTPAPIFWGSYDVNLTPLKVVPTFGSLSISYTSLEVDGPESTYAVGLDVGSIAVSALGDLACDGAPCGPLLAGALEPITFGTHTFAVDSDIISVQDGLKSPPVYVYFSNLTPVYYNYCSGINFTMPHNIIYVTFNGSAG
ncbi:hypothetical protein ASAC_0606 [Acidilobus saccharovorans 345-15]|uniref:Uncharacterized protein n=1 Tax=Acidilobus saccharovorans (strain DSM 16705 / JCM 18335 / VKM B-2471 / 345-15) TaxID=666510 RepID=D9Q125_ACIS3|nr:hypothetical protein ASAC_0606 [Acidilobus saccharovorans 345-15]